MKDLLFPAKSKLICFALAVSCCRGDGGLHFEKSDRQLDSSPSGSKSDVLAFRRVPMNHASGIDGLLDKVACYHGLER